MGEAAITDSEVHPPEDAVRRQALRGWRPVRVLSADEPAIEIAFPDAPALSKAARERAAFLRLLPSLMPAHTGRYVAIHGEEVVDSDADDIALVRRVHARIGYVPIHVGLVAAVPQVVRIPGFREVRPRGETV